MRPIKFRAWDKEKKEMRVGFFIGSIYGEVYCAEEIADRGKTLDPNNFVLLQFTGLLDKNGKEIYEGDVVRMTKHNSLWRVCWDESGEARWWIWWIQEQNGFWLREKTIKTDGIEVLGNIYENPELLK